ncbi:MAG: aminotransferase class V-fold PLP-dependent enzyme [Clostridia bacterium]
MIYFDNSATSRPKPNEVVNAVVLGLTTYCTNPGRSGHFLAMNASKKVEEIRLATLDFVGADENFACVFTHNCTQALNLAILGIAKQGDHFICTENDHNSVLRPLFELEARGIITVSVASCNNNGFITDKEIEPLIKENTKAVIANHISNVNGDECDIKSVGELCKNRNIIFVVDAAQSAGHKALEMINNNISMLALAGHKGLLGPQGIGSLIFNKSCKPNAIVFGGTGTSSLNLRQPNEIPDSLESGTIALPNILGFGAGIELVKNNFKEIKNILESLTEHALIQLSTLPEVTIKTNMLSVNGVISFEVKGMDSVYIAQMLSDNYKICVRPGYHCAPLKHKALGSEKDGLVRISFSYANTHSEINYFIKSLKNIINGF